MGTIGTPILQRDTLWGSILRNPGSSLIHFVLLALNICLVFWNIKGAQNCQPEICHALKGGKSICEICSCPSKLFFASPDPADPKIAPASFKIEHLWQDMDHGQNTSTYFGDPSPELDEAWAHLMKCKCFSLAQGAKTLADSTTCSCHGQDIRPGAAGNEHHFCSTPRWIRISCIRGNLTYASLCCEYFSQLRN